MSGGASHDGASDAPGWRHPVRRFRSSMRSRSLKTAFVLYAVGATVVALIVSLALGSSLSNAASRLWREAADVNGMYIYDAADDELVPAESLLWYQTGGDAIYVEQPSDQVRRPIPLYGPAEEDRELRIYDGRLLEDDELASGATNDPIPLADLSAYDARQRSLAPAGPDDLPSNAEGVAPAASPIPYYVTAYPANGLYDALQIGAFLVFPLVFVLVFFGTARLFYRNHIGRPLAILEDAASRIARSDLDFELAAEAGGNELCHLVGSVEAMRAELLASNRALWRMVESRREASAAFAHDLRTPLTVLKGQAEMLATYVACGALAPEQVEEMARSTFRQAERLERYVESMGDLARLDDFEPVATDVVLQSWSEHVAKTARALAESHGKTASVETAFAEQTARFDAEAALRVAENMLANAVRYAHAGVLVDCSSTERELAVVVEDDGPGFTEEALRRACEPYYRGDGAAGDGEHFGLGLGISAVLVKRCGGSLSISNRELGGARVEVRFPFVGQG